MPTQYRFEIVVRQWNTYRTRVLERIPTSILATDTADVTEKVRAIFNAKYDDFRHFWSHDWELTSIHQTIEGFHATRESGSGCPETDGGPHYFAFLDSNHNERICIDCGAPESDDSRFER